MTAEVAVLNRLAVALATDSAATVRGASNQSKVFNTAPKLFALSATEPVAAMIFGSASYGAAPWETIVKTFRSRLGEDTYGTIAEYAASFVDYLSSWVGYVPDGAQESFALAKIDYELERLEREADDFRSQDAPESGAILRHIGQAIRRRVELLEDEDSEEESEVFERLWTMATQRFESVGGTVGGFLAARLGLDESEASTILEGLRALAFASWGCIYDSPGATGLVIAGFGAEEMFPALQELRVEPPISGQVRVRTREAVSAQETAALIKPFAQGDMVYTFMDGIHPRYREVMISRVYDALDALKDAVVGALGDAVAPQVSGRLDAAVDYLADNVRQELAEFESEEMWGPIVDIVEDLGKDELAEVAETLVNLTSFRRRVTLDEHSVGGPVDVAVLSKGDGLTWIKRKHYFPAELNPRYFRSLQGLR